MCRGDLENGRLSLCGKDLFADDDVDLLCGDGRLFEGDLDLPEEALPDLRRVRRLPLALPRSAERPEEDEEGDL